MATAQDRKLEKKRRILESAYQLFKLNNVYNTAVDDIVKAAGIARGTFYLYFKDKSDLIEQLLFFKSAESMKAVMRRMHEQAGALTDMNACARAFITVYIDFLIDQKDVLVVIDKNISACMRYFPNFYDEEAKTLYTDIMNVFSRFGYDPEKLQKKIYMIIDMIGAVCSDAILFGHPYPIEDVREPLTEAAISILAGDPPAAGGILNA